MNSVNNCEHCKKVLDPAEYIYCLDRNTYRNYTYFRYVIPESDKWYYICCADCGYNFDKILKIKKHHIIYG